MLQLNSCYKRPCYNEVAYTDLWWHQQKFQIGNWFDHLLLLDYCTGDGAGQFMLGGQQTRVAHDLVQQIFNARFQFGVQLKILK